MDVTFKTKKGNLYTKEYREDVFYESEIPDQPQIMEKEPEKSVSRIPVRYSIN
jgi:hypothetical protein